MLRLCHNSHLFTLPGFAAPSQEFFKTRPRPLLADFLFICMVPEALFKKLIVDFLRCWDRAEQISVLILLFQFSLFCCQRHISVTICFNLGFPQRLAGLLISKRHFLLLQDKLWKQRSGKLSNLVKGSSERNWEDSCHGSPSLEGAGM